MVTCSSKEGERTRCPANTTQGVVLQRVTGSGSCILGSSWGYEADAIWVTAGCGGEFVVGGAAPKAEEEAAEGKNSASFDGFEPGEGFTVARTKRGELSISAYMLVRYINQLPPDQEFVDHLGEVRGVPTREDIFAHRILIFLKGWLWNPKFVYMIINWGINPTDQKALFGAIGYQFHPLFNLYAGLNALPGSRTLLGSHPFWLGHDRLMADEFFRPYFTHGIWANGALFHPSLLYQVMIGNNLSALGINAFQLTRDQAFGATVWWMPTTYEFGPNGSFDDWEWHEDVATRFGASYTYSHEDRFGNVRSGDPENNVLRLADSLRLFGPGSLAPDVSVLEARYRLLSLDAGVKYRGIFVGAEYYQRWLDNFESTGALPVTDIVDKGFYVQAAFYPVKKKVELYGGTSWVFGDKDAGFKTQHEWLGGANWFFAPTRNYRINAQVIWVNRSPVDSSFGYYVGGQKGPILSLATSIFF